VASLFEGGMTANLRPNSRMTMKLSCFAGRIEKIGRKKPHDFSGNTPLTSKTKLNWQLSVTQEPRQPGLRISPIWGTFDSSADVKG
jgi:hypothetical protein